VLVHGDVHERTPDRRWHLQADRSPRPEGGTRV
jgi:hypothetical protein